MFEKQGIKTYVLVPVILFIFLAIFDFNSDNRSKLQLSVDEVEKLLDGEYLRISPPPKSEEDFHNKSKKTSNILITTYYIANLSYEEIRIYYDKKLTENGWQFIKEKEIKRWDKPVGNALVFNKDQLYAIIYYYNNNIEYGRTYDFNMSWGIPEEAF